MVVAQLVHDPMQLLLGPGQLSHASFCVLFSLNEFLKFLEGEAVLGFIVGGVFFHDVFSYGGVFQSLHQGVHYRLVCAGGLAHG